MKPCVFYCVGGNRASSTAASILEKTYSLVQAPAESVTHLLLPIPSLSPDGTVIGGASLEEILAKLPNDITVVGGNLRHPKLLKYKTLDLLQDPVYLAENANITAHCAISYALSELPIILDRCPVLIFGWGRIGKCLARLLKQMGADVTIAARKDTDRAMISALGYKVSSIHSADAAKYRIIYNTVPEKVLPLGSSNAVKIDLASVRGMEGDDVILARSLPGRMAPESSGTLIAKTIMRLLKEKEDSI